MDGIGAPVKMKISIKYEKKGKDMFSDFWLSAVQTKKACSCGIFKAAGWRVSFFFSSLCFYPAARKACPPASRKLPWTG